MEIYCGRERQLLSECRLYGTGGKRPGIGVSYSAGWQLGRRFHIRAFPLHLYVKILFNLPAIGMGCEIFLIRGELFLIEPQNRQTAPGFFYRQLKPRNLYFWGGELMRPNGNLLWKRSATRSTARCPTSLLRQWYYTEGK